MATDSTSAPVQGVDMKQQLRRGVLAGTGSYLIWGALPLYWKALGNVSPVEIICNRIIWCFVFTALLCAFLKLDFAALLKDARARRFLIPASLLITFNWSVYIYAVSIGHIVEASLGYYINPIVSIVLGMVFFKERLTPLQWIAVALCCFGIGFFTVSYGQFPLMSILLALSFGLYGAVKKQGGYPAIQTIAVESALMLPFALIGAIGFALTGLMAGDYTLGWAGALPAGLSGTTGFLNDIVGGDGCATTLLLIGSGIATAAPLVLYTYSANNIPLTLLGFLQYLSPSISLLIGVLLFGEPFTFSHAVCFGCIWSALALVSIDSLRAARRSRKTGQPTLLEREEQDEEEEREERIREARDCEARGR